MVCDHCVVSYAPITVIFPLSGSTMCYLGYPIHTKPTQWSYGARCEVPLPPWCPPTTQQSPLCVVMVFWAFEYSRRPSGSTRSSRRQKRLRTHPTTIGNSLKRYVRKTVHSNCDIRAFPGLSGPFRALSGPFRVQRNPGRSCRNRCSSGLFGFGIATTADSDAARPRKARAIASREIPSQSYAIKAWTCSSGLLTANFARKFLSICKTKGTPVSAIPPETALSGGRHARRRCPAGQSAPT